MSPPRLLWSILRFLTSAGRLDCSQDYHRLWLPDCSGRKTEQCAERPGGEQSRCFGGCSLARYRFEQGRSDDRTVHSPSPPQRSQPRCPRWRYRLESASSLTLPWDNERGSRQRPHEVNVPANSTRVSIDYRTMSPCAYREPAARNEHPEAQRRRRLARTRTARLRRGHTARRRNALRLLRPTSCHDPFVPAQAGTQDHACSSLDSRLRGTFPSSVPSFVVSSGT